MTDPIFDDETLMAFADGELDAQTSAAVEEAMRDDEQLVARISLFMETRKLSAEAMEPLLDVSVPDDLTKTVSEMLDTSAEDESPRDNVVSFRAGPAPHRQPAASHWITALAASVALVAGGVIGFAVGNLPGDGAGSVIQVAQFDQPDLPGALETTISGAEMRLPASGHRFRAIASFHDQDKSLCREFELDQDDGSTFVSVACRTGAGWKVNFTVAAASQSESGYAPASSLESLDAYLTAIGAGTPLGEAEEAAALKALAGRS